MWPPTSLEQTLVRIGHEVEEVIPVGPVAGPLTVGRVTEVEELTGFKKPIRASRSTSAMVDREIVCGATNFVVGDLVVVALPGSTLPADFTITARKTYGRTSDGMICSAAELSLGADHSGILVLPRRHRDSRATMPRRCSDSTTSCFTWRSPRPGLLPVGARPGPRDRCRLRPGLRRPGPGPSRCLSRGRPGRSRSSPKRASAGSRCARSPGSTRRPCRRGGCSAGCCCPASARSRRRWT